MGKKVIVSGCFDLMHSGHIAFLRQASDFGQLYVCIGSDQTVEWLKGRRPINGEKERKYMLESLQCVFECKINSGSGYLDFIKELEEIRPDCLVVNEDGHSPDKEKLCKERGIDYIILKREPFSHLPARSTTALKNICDIPFRLDLAGGWLDQPFVSAYCPGPVITISIEPLIEFNSRSGMAGSSRNKAIELWKNRLPDMDPVQMAKLLFSYENPPGTKDIAGSQDALGICLPGINKLNYNKGYWPQSMLNLDDEDILSWLEQSIYLVSLGPRSNEYDVLYDTRIDAGGARQLSEAASKCWDAILKKDLSAFGMAVSASFDAQTKMFPLMLDDSIRNMIEKYKTFSAGYKLSGAGGGGYLVLVSDQPVENGIRLKIRRKNLL